MIRFIRDYWRLMRAPTKLEVELERDREFAARGWMRIGQLERERAEARTFRFG